MKCCIHNFKSVQDCASFIHKSHESLTEISVTILFLIKVLKRMFIVLEKFLKVHNFSKVISDFEDYYQSHPNYPSLFALTDTLSFLNIENVAARIEKNQLDELPESFLGYVSNDIQSVELALIHKQNELIEVTFEGKKTVKYSSDDFKVKWNGVVVAIEPNEEEVYFASEGSTLIGSLIITCVIGLFCISNYSGISALALISFLLYVSGGVLSFLIIREKMNSEQSGVSKICSFGENTSCDSVIKSTKAKITSWVDFSDLPILFFFTSIVAMLIEPSSYLWLNALSILALPVVVYSIWLQYFILKTWCTLCIGVSVVLLLQMFTTIGSLTEIFSMEFRGVISACLIIPTWFFVRNYLNDNQSLRKKNQELIRFKRNFEVYQFLEKPLKISSDHLISRGIELGNNQNPITMTLIVSPSCGHCHKAFEEALNLYHLNSSKIRLVIFYNLNPANKNNPTLKIALNTLALYEERPNDIVQALSDWHIDQIGLEPWMEKWGRDNTDIEFENDLLNQYTWCEENGFNYTPVKIINDSEIPKEYTLEEMKFFISEMEDLENTEPLIVD